MTVAVARKQAPDSTYKAKRDGARDASTISHRTRGGLQIPIIQREPICACDGGCPRCKERAAQAELKIGRVTNRLNLHKGVTDAV